MNYHSSIDFLSEENKATELFKYSCKLFNNTDTTIMPHPKIIRLLKGNFGECIFKKLLLLYNINFFETLEIVNKIGFKAYELFDFYIIINNKLICIDVKNWSANLDNSKLSLATHKKSLAKIKIIKELVNNKYEEICFIYVNTRLEYNSYNLVQYNNEGNIYYLNLFNENIFYEGKKINNKTCSELTKKIIVNEQLIEVLKGV
jgi:hypothetical protein